MRKLDVSRENLCHNWMLSHYSIREELSDKHLGNRVDVNRDWPVVLKEWMGKTNILSNRHSAAFRCKCGKSLWSKLAFCKNTTDCELPMRQYFCTVIVAWIVPQEENTSHRLLPSVALLLIETTFISATQYNGLIETLKEFVNDFLGKCQCRKF